MRTDAFGAATPNQRRRREKSVRTTPCEDVPRDINPRDAGRETSKIAGEVPNGLADDFEVAHNGVDKPSCRTRQFTTSVWQRDS